MSSRFEQCLGTFTMLFVEGSSETRLFRHLSNYVFGVPKFGNTKLWGSSFCLKRSKFNLGFKKVAANPKKVFCFRDNYIWVGIVKSSLLRTGYFSSAGNVLTSSPKILHVNKGDFFQLNWFGSHEWIWQRWCHADSYSVSARLRCCLSKGSL